MKYICGIDEAGRGPLAGPVTAAAVVLPDDFPFELLADSKSISSRKRDRAETVIKDLAVAWSIAWVSPKSIDVLNIHQASLLAMQRAFNSLPTFIRDSCEVVADGKYIPEVSAPAAAVVRGDSLIHEIMAASILAKTARDAWMIKAAEKYPNWGFDRHKGYPTKEHRTKCSVSELTPIHRKSFTSSYSS
ncbi:MAG: ribonuclease HII [Spirochaetia bacterium]|nr:ribonuclease HII [Spirochaetia bacterium]